MDSGIGESVSPPSMAPGVNMEESPGSKRGQHYTTSSAGRLPNMGQQKLRVKTNEGKDTRVVYQITEGLPDPLLQPVQSAMHQEVG